MKLKSVLATLLILTSFVTSFSQTRFVTIKEWLPDGTVIIQIEDVQYRALPPEKMREVVTKLEAAKVTQEAYTTLQADFQTFRVKTEEARQIEAEKSALQIKKAVEQADFWSTEYMKENKLRLERDKFLKSCTGKIVFFRICTK